MQNTIKFSLLSVTLLSQLYAAENQYTLDTITVSSSQGTTLNKKDVTDDITIITKEELEESHTTTLNDALLKLANMSVTQNGGVGTSSSVYIRGMQSSRILVLVDGVRYNDPSSIGAIASFSQIMLSDVQQIEIIKGAQSGVWGSDASGGVINIITTNAQKGLHAKIATEYGSFNSAKLYVQSSYKDDKISALADALTYTTDGFSSAAPKAGTPEYGERYDGYKNNPYINRTYNMKFGYNITKNDKIKASVNVIKSLLHFDNGAGQDSITSLPLQKYFNRFYSVSYTHKDSINEIKAQYNNSVFDRRYTYSFGKYNYSADVKEVKIEDKIAYLDNSFFRIGGAYQKFEQKDITPNKNKAYEEVSAFATNYNKLKLFSNLDTIITESLRYDKYTAFDDSTTGKIGIKQFFKHGFYIAANAGTGYNAPTLGQLYGQFGANPNLKPEKSFTSDITLGNDKLWITGFYNEITDLIEYQFSTSPAGYIQTSGKSKFKGYEVGYKDFLADSLGLKALYTYLLTQNAKGQTLARRPINQLDLTAIYYLNDAIDIDFNAQYIGTRYDQANNHGAQTGRYTVADITANMQINPKVGVYAKINNITDKYYQTVDGYATPRRSLYIGLNAKY